MILKTTSMYELMFLSGNQSPVVSSIEKKNVAGFQTSCSILIPEQLDKSFWCSAAKNGEKLRHTFILCNYNTTVIYTPEALDFCDDVYKLWWYLWDSCSSPQDPQTAITKHSATYDIHNQNIQMCWGRTVIYDRSVLERWNRNIAYFTNLLDKKLKVLL